MGIMVTIIYYLAPIVSRHLYYREGYIFIKGTRVISYLVLRVPQLYLVPTNYQKAILLTIVWTIEMTIWIW